jgi:hypothetical protein
MGSGKAPAIWCAISAGVRQLVSTASSAARIIQARDDPVGGEMIQAPGLCFSGAPYALA